MAVRISKSTRKDSSLWHDDPQRVPRSYPWTDWTDGGVWEIFHGPDFDVPVESMQSMLHQRAKTMSVDGIRIRVRTRRIGDDAHGSGIRLQFYKD